MIVGFKTGPKNFSEGQRIVQEEDARMCEIWFDVTNYTSYQGMLEWLGAHNVAIGLHHWGLVDGIYKTNLMCKDAHIRTETIAQIKQTIDIASTIGAVYVNVHPGALAIETMNFADDTQAPAADKPVTARSKATSLLLEGALELTTYAHQKNVLLTIENLPALEKKGGNQEAEPVYNPENATLDDARMLAGHDIFLANDITHAAAQLAIINSDLLYMWRELEMFTKDTFAHTKLVHINTVEPPYMGADSHGGITREDFYHDRFPSRSQLISLLSMYKNREDVFIIPEPKSNMYANYLALQELVRLAEAE